MSEFQPGAAKTPGSGLELPFLVSVIGARNRERGQERVLDRQVIRSLDDLVRQQAQVVDVSLDRLARVPIHLFIFSSTKKRQG